MRAFLTAALAVAGAASLLLASDRGPVQSPPDQSDYTESVEIWLRAATHPAGSRDHGRRQDH